MERTEIATMGEFGLIKHLTKDLKTVQPSTKKSVGDDCAVMDFNEGLAVTGDGLRAQLPPPRRGGGDGACLAEAARYTCKLPPEFPFR